MNMALILVKQWNIIINFTFKQKTTAYRLLECSFFLRPPNYYYYTLHPFNRRPLFQDNMGKPVLEM